MQAREVADQIVKAIGGADNLVGCEVFATRLHVSTLSVADVDVAALNAVHGVLGCFYKGGNVYELVLGPRLTDDVARILGNLADGIPDDDASPLSPEQRDDEDGDEASAIGDMIDSMNVADNVLPRSLLVINGPNINMLGRREPEIYGSNTYEHLIEICNEAAADAGFDSCECLQSNHEGDLVDYIQQAFGNHDGIVINPAAYTHTSVALLDALKAVRIPAVEVHISNVDQREEFRQVSYVREACIATVSGRGIEGYRDAIELLAQHLGI